ncbi:MAG: TnpV protein [Clostridiales bacterium]|nr:TnpV protein [Clostridiales bacterium]
MNAFLEYRQNPKDGLLYPVFKEEENPIELIYWGKKRMRFLYQNYKIQYLKMRQKGTLLKHCKEVEEEAEEKMEILTKQMEKAEGLTLEMQQQDWLTWVQLKQNIKNRAEEIVLNEIIFVPPYKDD